MTSQVLLNTYQSLDWSFLHFLLFWIKIQAIWGNKLLQKSSSRREFSEPQLIALCGLCLRQKCSHWLVRMKKHYWMLIQSSTCFFSNPPLAKKFKAKGKGTKFVITKLPLRVPFKSFYDFPQKEGKKIATYHFHSARPRFYFDFCSISCSHLDWPMWTRAQRILYSCRSSVCRTLIRHDWSRNMLF